MDDGLHLHTLCQTAYAGSDTDDWRRREWPFAQRAAAETHVVSLCSSRGVGAGLPASWAIVEQDTRAEPEKAETCVGLLTLTHADETSASALLGTYITPRRRGLRVQREAKRQLFALPGLNVRQFICLVHKDNLASLQGVMRCASIATVSQKTVTELPRPMQEEWWRMGCPPHILCLTPLATV